MGEGEMGDLVQWVRAGERVGVVDETILRKLDSKAQSWCLGIKGVLSRSNAARFEALFRWCAFLRGMGILAVQKGHHRESVGVGKNHPSRAP